MLVYQRVGWLHLTHRKMGQSKSPWRAAVSGALWPSLRRAVSDRLQCFDSAEEHFFGWEAEI